MVDDLTGTDYEAQQALIALIKVSDYIIVPVQPSPVDIRSSAKFINLVRERQQVVGKPEYRMLATRRKHWLNQEFGVLKNLDDKG